MPQPALRNNRILCDVRGMIAGLKAIAKSSSAKPDHIALVWQNGRIELSATVDRRVKTIPVDGANPQSGAGGVVLPHKRTLDLFAIFERARKSGDPSYAHPILISQCEDEIVTIRTIRGEFRFATLSAPSAPEIVTEHARPLDAIGWESVAERYRSGVGLTELGRQFGVPASSVHGRLKKLGVIFDRKRRRIGA